MLIGRRERGAADVVDDPALDHPDVAGLQRGDDERAVRPVGPDFLERAGDDRERAGAVAVVVQVRAGVGDPGEQPDVDGVVAAQAGPPAFVGTEAHLRLPAGRVAAESATSEARSSAASGGRRFRE